MQIPLVIPTLVTRASPIRLEALQTWQRADEELTKNNLTFLGFRFYAKNTVELDLIPEPLGEWLKFKR